MAGCSNSPSSCEHDDLRGWRWQDYTVGVLTDLSGPAGSEFGTAINGVKAGIGVAKSEGYNIKYVVADTQTNPTVALSGAQKLVEQDHVFSVLGLSALTFEASNYLTSNKVPVVGAAFDGLEWLKPPPATTCSRSSETRTTPRCSPRPACS